MASGRNHDRATWICCLPLGLALGLIFGVRAGVIGAAACLVGGLWLSPDLDTQCLALRRWGPLGFIWWPYRQLIPHRSIWSHGPLIGTTLRLAVLLGWSLIFSLLVPWLSPAMVVASLERLITQHPNKLLSLVIGIEASVWLHLILDGDPWPREWSNKRQR